MDKEEILKDIDEFIKDIDSVIEEKENQIKNKKNKNIISNLVTDERSVHIKEQLKESSLSIVDESKRNSYEARKKLNKNRRKKKKR